MFYNIYGSAKVSNVECFTIYMVVQILLSRMYYNIYGSAKVSNVDCITIDMVVQRFLM